MIILGHSMGGSIATKATAEIFKNEDYDTTGLLKHLTKKICGLIVIDVVEGSAIDALPFMESIVKGRPKVFKDKEAAIEYM
jgi:protein phosphatase methylesterase 1